MWGKKTGRKEGENIWCLRGGETDYRRDKTKRTLKNDLNDKKCRGCLAKGRKYN